MSQGYTKSNIITAVGNDGWVPANETWTYASTTTYTNSNTTYACTITVPTDATTKYTVGMRVKFTQSTGGTKYGIITAVAATLLTVFLGTDYTLVNEAITAPYYSTVKAPFGFPLAIDKWTVTTSDTSSRTQASPTQNVWYNLGSISIDVPLGDWMMSYQVLIYLNDTTASTYNVYATLSTVNNTESNNAFTRGAAAGVAARQIQASVNMNAVYATGNDVYYLNTKTGYASVDTIGNLNDAQALYIKAICSYL